MPNTFRSLHDLFRGFVSKYQEILTKYLPAARESTDPPKTKQKTKKTKKYTVTPYNSNTALMNRENGII